MVPGNVLCIIGVGDILQAPFPTSNRSKNTLKPIVSTLVPSSLINVWRIPGGVAWAEASEGLGHSVFYFWNLPGDLGHLTCGPHCHPPEHASHWLFSRIVKLIAQRYISSKGHFL